MRAHYDREADALYVRFSDTEVRESEEVAPGIMLDFDAQKRLVGFEVLDAQKNLAEGTPLDALSRTPAGS